MTGWLAPRAARSLNLLTPGLPLGDLLLDIADGVWQDWQSQRREQDRRTELQVLTKANAQEVRRQVAEVLAEVAAHQPPQVREALAAYLAQVPATICQSLRRPDDPTGTTVPGWLKVRRAADLLRFLPTHLPRFRPGVRPLPGADRELVELLGAGGFGEVWKARTEAGSWVALKFCLDPDTAKALENEAHLLARVTREGKHRGIVALLHTYLDANPPCLEYEYVGGGDLAGLIQEWHRNGGLTPEEATRVILRLTEIVAFTHALQPPIVHRDLKPANILVQVGSKGGWRFKIADFGIGGLAARQEIVLATRGASSPSAGRATAVRGAYTPLYASPEQIRGERPDPRDDIHALGVIWYQLLTGDLTRGLPTGLRWMKELRRRGMSEAAVRLLASCFDTHPDARPADAGVLAAVLDRLLPHPEPTRARPQAPVGVWAWVLLAVVIVATPITLALALLATSQKDVKRTQDQDKAQAAPDAEEEAARRLRLAKALLKETGESDKSQERFRSRLQAIAEKYPKTAAGAEARKLLEDLP
jgi:hypothetical protein